MNRRPAMLFIFITILIDVTGLGIIIPVMPSLISELTGIPLAQNQEFSLMGGALMATYAIMQFIFAPIVGGLSDKYGRRPVLLGSLLGFGIDYLFLAFAPTLGWLFLGRAIAGMLGASFSTAGAYIADISETPEDRGKNFGMMGAAFGLGFVVGPALGGLLGDMGSRVPFMVSAGLSLINCLYGFFVLPESLKPENRRKFEWKRSNPFGTLKQLWQYKIVAGLLFSLGFIYISMHAVQSNWSMYTIKKFLWGPKEIGISLAVIGIATAIVQGGLIRAIIPRLGQQRSVYFGLGMYALGFVLFAFASQGWMMYAFTFVYCLGGICGPAMQGIMAGTVPPNAQGELQGGFTSLMSLTSIFGPLIMAGLFHYAASDTSPVYFPGAPMMLGAILSLVSSLLARRTLKLHLPRVKA
jgi:DHA1 family tetracycline resistance protein-like MFS transporter